MNALIREGDTVLGTHRPTTTQPGAGAESIPDLVGRDFTADAPGTKLVGDITY